MGEDERWIEEHELGLGPAITSLHLSITEVQVPAALSALLHNLTCSLASGVSPLQTILHPASSLVFPRHCFCSFTLFKNISVTCKLLIAISLNLLPCCLKSFTTRSQLYLHVLLPTSPKVLLRGFIPYPMSVWVQRKVVMVVVAFEAIG